MGALVNLHKLLPLLDPQHLLLDTPLDHKPYNPHAPLLPHAVHAVDSLRLHGKAPPRVHHEDVARARQIEAYAAGTQGQ